MNVGQVTMNTSMAMIVRQLEGMAEMQMAVMKEMADSQQQIAGLLLSDKWQRLISPTSIFSLPDSELQSHESRSQGSVILISSWLVSYKFPD